MEISPDEREKILFLFGIGNKQMLKDYLSNNLDEEKISDISIEVISNAVYFVDWDDEGLYKNFYKCKYCGFGQHEHNYFYKPQRYCRNKKYFKHKIDCPVLMAKDFLIGR